MRGPFRPSARSRPLVVLLLWLWDAALGFFLGSAASAVVSSAYGNHPDGDLSVFAPGGLVALDLMRHSLAARGPLVTFALVVVAMASLGGVLPGAIAYAQLAGRDARGGAPSVRTSVVRAVDAAPAAFTVTVVCLVAQALSVVAGFVIGSAASSALPGRYSDAVHDEVAALGVCAGVVCGALVGVLADLARGAVVLRAADARHALTLASTQFVSRPVRLFAAYGWRFLAGLLPLALGATLATRIGGRPGAPLVALLVVHQAVLIARAAIRSSWMACALRELARPADGA